MPDHDSVSLGLQGFLRQAAESIKQQPWSNPPIIAVALALGALLIHARSRPDWLLALSVSYLTASAAAATGAILGFLFGIPRVQQDASRSPQGSSEPLHLVNTNLEQISDWLTKIIVGLGLVNLVALRNGMMDLSRYMADAYGSPAVPPSFVAAVLLFFATSGFLLTYLWTRLLLSLEFTRADRAAIQSPEYYEGYIHALLYQPAPSGFEGAIDAGTDFIKRYGEGNWRVWRSLAYAYGQQYSYIKNTKGVSAPELAVAEESAYKACEHVLSINGSEKQSLRSLWDPKLATPQENDLVVFSEVQRFKELLAG